MIKRSKGLSEKKGKNTIEDTYTTTVTFRCTNRHKELAHELWDDMSQAWREYVELKAKEKGLFFA